VCGKRFFRINGFPIKAHRRLSYNGLVFNASIIVSRLPNLVFIAYANVNNLHFNQPNLLCRRRVNKNCRCFQAQTLIAYVEKQSSQYRTNNIILTMGDDFQYTDAAVNFYSMDKLIKLVYTIAIVTI